MHVKYKVHKLHGRYILKYIILSCAGKQGIVVIVACKRLTPPPKGLQPMLYLHQCVLPLQVYKFLYACRLAEYGLVQEVRPRWT